MSAKDIEFEEKAQKKILRGLSQLADAVKCTMGPKGRTVVIEQSWGFPSITKDGATVAEAIELEDRHENMGAMLGKEVAKKVADQAGDGTTTSIVLTKALYQEGLRYLSSGADPVRMKEGMDEAIARGVKYLKTLSRPVENKETMRQVATISANQDQEVGSIVADAFERVGKDGTVTIEEGKGLSTELKVVEGMTLDKGYASPYFITDAEKMESVPENAYVLVADQKISSAKDFVPLLGKIGGKPLLIIAEDVEGEALRTLVINRVRGGMNLCVVKAPGFGDRRKAVLEDIAIFTGAKMFSEELGTSLDKTSVEDLGLVQKAIIREKEAILMGGNGNVSSVEDRRAALRKQIQEASSDYDRDKLRERLANLSGGVAVIYVGAPTEVAAKEKKDRVDDSKRALAAAMEEGVVPGGGTALIRVAQHLKPWIDSLDEETKVGASIVHSALYYPARQIVSNAGLDSSVVLQEVLQRPTEEGYDAMNGDYGNMFEKGIQDPTKVVRMGLEFSGSVSSVLMNTTALIAEKEKEENAPAHV